MSTDLDQQQLKEKMDNNEHETSNQENLKFYKRFKDCTEHNRELNKEFAKVVDNKYNVILEISALQKGELYEEKAPGMTEEVDNEEEKIPEYDPSESWILHFSRAARENVALLKRIKELNDELQELTEERNKLFSEAEFKSATNGRKKARGAPYDPQAGNTGTRQLFGRIDPQERIEALINASGQGGIGAEIQNNLGPAGNNNMNRSLFNPFNDYNNNEQRGQGGFRGQHNQQSGESWFKKL